MNFFTSSIIQGSMRSPGIVDLPAARALWLRSLPPGRDGGPADLVRAVLAAQPFRLAEGLADLRERVDVRDDLGERVLPLVLLEERERSLDRPRLVLDHPHDGVGPPDDGGGVELELVPRADVADLEIRPAALEHLEAFGDDAREPDEVADDVGPPAPRQLLHRRHAVLGPGQLLEAQRVVGTESPGELEALRDL